MRRAGVRVLGGVLAVGATVGLGWLSQVPYPATEPADALIRLAWRARSHRLEECRRLSPAELAELPPHMRREEVCEGRLLPYRLRVMLDGRTVLDADVQPAGARADRPLYVFHEIRVAPGERLVEVAFVRADVMPAEASGGEAGRGRASESDAMTVAGGASREAPPVLRFARLLALEAGQVTLVTYDAEARQLVTKGYGVVP